MRDGIELRAYIDGAWMAVGWSAARPYNFALLRQHYAARHIAIAIVRRAK